FYVDMTGYFASNWYSGQRSPAGSSSVAYGNFEGHQSGVYTEGGYKFDMGHDIVLTPLTSLQWTHLAIDGYGETSAGVLDAQVDRQSYDILESGLGAGISKKLQYNWGSVTPEFHAKWLYDFINDRMKMTVNLPGASYVALGANPGRDAADLGGRLSFDLPHGVSFIAQCDTQIRDNFFEVSGSVALKYKF
ncbi:MAG: autotransporter outer membrane beta-barrel domain-containing protein, partial [Candidatus Omnitrophica bacterium]|nr:autotransporter outer membrane beta-barrel domain-containing protein [Candidatus Omnitrophota bacterium]